MKRLPLSLVPKRKSKHAAQVIHQPLSVLLIQVDDGLRIGVGIENVSAPYQVPSQFTKVVDLAVEHHPHSSVFIANRLSAGSNVDDAQAAHAQAYSRAEVVTLVVGTPVGDGHTHIPHFLLENRFAFQANDAGNSAHSPCTLYPLS